MNHNRAHALRKGQAMETVGHSRVARELADTRWDWLRGPVGLRFVVVLSFLVLFVAPVVVWFVEDRWGLVPLAFVASVFLTWFLLRRAVRLVMDAPDHTLDERLIAVRNQAYFLGYRALAGVMGTGASLLLLWSIIEIRSGAEAAAFSLTWPQVNALLWFVLAQVVLLPSLALAMSIHRRKVQL